MKADYDKAQVGTRLEPVLPDAYFVVSIPNGKLHFFLEYDRGGESLKFFKKKMAAYVSYFRTKKSEARYGTDMIRVLTVAEGRQKADSKKRLKSLMRTTEQVGGWERFLFTTMVDVVGDDFLSGMIWRTAEKEGLSVLVTPEG